MEWVVVRAEIHNWPRYREKVSVKHTVTNLHLYYSQLQTQGPLWKKEQRVCRDMYETVPSGPDRTSETRNPEPLRLYNLRKTCTGSSQSTLGREGADTERRSC